ncbi:unnamed protein product [Acanthoscelides obtectus]|uniref:Uncharacterized protein n=1 Tax=Acanthoscelides obtectus TaxID=200917 RepID=A0A9P0K9Q3_ACAOB|nr:unnamed protein product [Acanthoscelides obtectus]CAK1667354.1 hypothetical protein AOBTE_LOCUS25796 [Acanthoscelides obtectus]
MEVSYPQQDAHFGLVSKVTSGLVCIYLTKYENSILQRIYCSKSCEQASEEKNMDMEKLFEKNYQLEQALRSKQVEIEHQKEMENQQMPHLLLNRMFWREKRSLKN